MTAAPFCRWYGKERITITLEGQRERAEQAAEEGELERYLHKVWAYSGTETKLEENLFIPLIAGIEEFEIKIEVIRLAVKFGYICPLVEEELSPSTARRGEIASAHPAYQKYKQEILHRPADKIVHLRSDASVDIYTLIEWEYEEAMDYLAGYVPKGYYIGFEPDFGWGVFRHGSFEQGD